MSPPGCAARIADSRYLRVIRGRHSFGRNGFALMATAGTTSAYPWQEFHRGTHQGGSHYVQASGSHRRRRTRHGRCRWIVDRRAGGSGVVLSKAGSPPRPHRPATADHRLCERGHGQEGSDHRDRLQCARHHGRREQHLYACRRPSTNGSRARYVDNLGPRPALVRHEARWAGKATAALNKRVRPRPRGQADRWPRVEHGRSSQAERAERRRQPAVLYLTDDAVAARYGRQHRDGAPGWCNDHEPGRLVRPRLAVGPGAPIGWTSTITSTHKPSPACSGVTRKAAIHRGKYRVIGAREIPTHAATRGRGRGHPGRRIRGPAAAVRPPDRAFEAVELRDGTLATAASRQQGRGRDRPAWSRTPRLRGQRAAARRPVRAGSGRDRQQEHDRGPTRFSASSLAVAHAARTPRIYRSTATWRAECPPAAGADDEHRQRRLARRLDVDGQEFMIAPTAPRPSATPSASATVTTR